MSFLSDLMDNESLAAVPVVDAAPPGAVLALDIGNVHTRAALIDIVDGQYRFVSRGEAPTTSGPPWSDILEGVRHALDEIAGATGRRLLDERHQLIIPERDEFYGVNAFVATASAGKAIRAILVGLVPDVSLASGRRAAESTYLQLTDTISLADPRTPENQIDAILRNEPDMIMIVGGTDGGAEDSLIEQLNKISLATRLMERQFRPMVLFAGNKELQPLVREELGDAIGMRVVMAENVRPRLDVERLDSAQTELAALYQTQKANSTGGFSDIGGWSKQGVQPTAHGFSRMVRVLGELNRHDVLGIDLGSASTTVAASIKGQSYLNVFPNMGIGHAARDVLSQFRQEAITRWLTYDLRHADDVRDYVNNKSLFPHIVPANPFDLELEYAIAREIIRRAVANARVTWRDVRRRGLLPVFGTILLSGSTLTRTPSDGWSGLIALDALLPVGVTRLLIDPYGLAPSLGAAALINPTSVVQVLETGAFYDLGTVVSLSGRSRQGDVVLRGSFKPEGVRESQPFEVPFGSVSAIPIPKGVRTEVMLKPRRVEIEDGPHKITVTGGELGLVVDGRGRPWRFPREARDRQGMIKRWIESMTRGA